MTWELGGFTAAAGSECLQEPRRETEKGRREMGIQFCQDGLFLI